MTTVPCSDSDRLLVPIDDVMDLLGPFPRHNVHLNHLESVPRLVACALAVGRIVVATSLAATFERIARVIDECERPWATELVGAPTIATP